VLREKIGAWERPVNGAMYRGTVLEPHARHLYTLRTRFPAPPCCVEMLGCPWARVSLDGLCTNGAVLPGERLDWLLELKCPSWEVHSAALAGVVPDYYAAQVQWQLLVCGLSRADFATFNPSKRFTPAGAVAWEEWRALPERSRPEAPADWLAVVPVAADPDQQAWLYTEAARFWFEVLEAREALAAEAAKAAPAADERFAAEVI